MDEKLDLVPANGVVFATNPCSGGTEGADKHVAYTSPKKRGLMPPAPIKASELKRIATVARQMQSTIEIEENGRVIRIIPNNCEEGFSKKVVPMQGALM